METNNGETISVSQAASLAGVTNQTIRNLCRNGVLPFKMKGCQYMPLKSAVEEHRESIGKINNSLLSIEQYENDLYGKQKRLESAYRNAKDSIEMLGVSPKRLRFIIALLKAVMSSYAEHVTLTPREKELLDYALLGDKTFNNIVLGETISPKGVGYAWHKLLRNIAFTKNEISTLRESVKNKDKKIAELKEYIKRAEEEAQSVAQTKIQDDYIISVLGTKVDMLDLSIRSLNCLRAADITTVADIVRCNRRELLKFRNFGKKSILEIDEFLESRGLNFGMDLSPYIDD